MVRSIGVGPSIVSGKNALARRNDFSSGPPCPVSRTSMFRAPRLIASLLLATLACHGSTRSASVGSVAHGEVAAAKPNQRTPNEMGRIPILEYHLLGDSDSRWHVERNHFRRDLERLYAAGYRPVSVSEMIDKKIDLPAGESPVVFTFDDAGPSQFSYIDNHGTLEITRSVCHVSSPARTAAAGGRSPSSSMRPSTPATGVGWMSSSPEAL